jgi:hypothetical protein
MALLVASCSGSSDSDVECVEPPTSELEQTSELALSVEPHPVDGGAKATLSIELDGLPADTIVGAGVEWQCWDGSDWAPTHQIIRAFGEFEPVTNEVAPGATTAVVAIGLSVPNSYEIIIPDVAPGIYRIADHAIVPGGEVSGFVMVEVR